MNIVNALFIYSLTNFFIANAMDHVPLLSQQETSNFHTIQINRPQDIPRKLSFQTIGLYFEKLSETKRDTLCATTNDQNLSLLSESFTFNVAYLPKELIYKIITYMFDKDAISAQFFITTPLFYAYQRYHQAREMIEKSSLKNNQPIHLLFRLPSEKQKKIMDPLTPSFISKLIYDGITITDKDNQQIISYSQEIKEKFFADENIVVIDNKAEQKCCSAVVSIAMIGTLIGLTCGTVCALTARMMTKDGTIPVVLFLGITVFGSMIGLISGTIHRGRNARENSHPIDI